MNSVELLLANSAFSEPCYVEGREAIANLFPKTKRCGIYVLHFHDGMYYVGQSTDVTRRYVEHKRNYTDIIKLSFKQVEQSELDFEERRIRNLLQDNGHTLRGVIGIYPLPGEADLDLIIPIPEQQEWIKNLSLVDYSGSRTKNPPLRKTHEGKFKRLAKKQYFRDAIEILQTYIRIGIPRIRATEETFWSCSCLPSTAVYVRININWQEVFAISENAEGLECSFQIALSPLHHTSLIKGYFDLLPEIPFSVTFDDEICLTAFSNEQQRLLQKAGNAGQLEMSDETYAALAYYLGETVSTSISSYRYIPGGDDQIRFEVKGKEQILDFLNDKTIITAIRQFNLRLMRLGPGPFKTSHCLDLADLIVQGE